MGIKCWFGQPAASGTPALDKEVVHVRCAPVGNFLVVAPVLGRSAIKSQQSRRRASSLLMSPLLGTASPCLYLAAIPPHLCRGEPRQKCSGRPGCSRPRCCRLLAQRVSAPLCSGPHPAPVGARADVEASCFYSWGSASSRGRLCPAWALVRAHSFGPFRPRPRRPSATHRCRSLPAAGSLRSPVRVPVKARQPFPHNAADRLRGHAPLAALVPRPWSLGDSLPARAIPPHPSCRQRDSQQPRLIY